MIYSIAAVISIVTYTIMRSPLYGAGQLGSDGLRAVLGALVPTPRLERRVVRAAEDALLGVRELDDAAEDGGDRHHDGEDLERAVRADTLVEQEESEQRSRDDAHRLDRPDRGARARPSAARSGRRSPRRWPTPRARTAPSAAPTRRCRPRDSGRAPSSKAQRHRRRSRLRPRGARRAARPRVARPSAMHTKTAAIALGPAIDPLARARELPTTGG